MDVFNEQTCSLDLAWLCLAHVLVNLGVRFAWNNPYQWLSLIFIDYQILSMYILTTSHHWNLLTSGKPCADHNGWGNCDILWIIVMLTDYGYLLQVCLDIAMPRRRSRPAARHGYPSLCAAWLFHGGTRSVYYTRFRIFMDFLVTGYAWLCYVIMLCWYMLQLS